MSHFKEPDVFAEEDETSESIAFFFDISKEVKHFYETPVIFLTHKDYSDCIFNTMCNIRSYLRTGSKIKSVLIDYIAEYHFNWLRIILDIETFKKIAKNIPREDIYESISYTIDAVNDRLKYYQRYMTKYRVKLSNKHQSNLLSDMEIVEEMHRDMIKILLERLLCFRAYTCDHEFLVKVLAATEELGTWIDKIHDSLSIMLCRYFNYNLPNLLEDLAKTLQQIVENLHNSDSMSAITLLADLKSRGHEKSTMVQYTVTRNLEMAKLIEKIAVLDDRIRRLEEETTTAAVLALQHKKEYLTERLESLEKLKINLKSLTKVSSNEPDKSTDDFPRCAGICKDFYQVRIFNHLLPQDIRETLVTDLLELWNTALGGEQTTNKSIISILSVADVKEEFSDELGTFTIDEHGRKIYKLPYDTTIYQSNERNELVPLSDDADHVYFYDECGRYYHDPKTRQRVYKATDTASEYMMDSSGTLLKVREERGGITYYYDNFGRYYINENGKNIYREPDSLSEYENDGLGNLVRIRSHLDIFNPCPDDVNVTEDFKYLESVVGIALRKCIAKVILVQPVDPIKYLSELLKKFRANMEFQERQLQESAALEAEREFIRAEERAAQERAALEAALLAEDGSEASQDSNFINYNRVNVDNKKL